MKALEHCTHAYEETLALGARFARILKRGDVVCLFGDLGSGKTAFVKGMAKGLKISPHQVHSPTFTLMNIYKGKVPLYHFDLYRIKAFDLFGMGYEEFFYGQGIAAVEWSERLETLMPGDCWQVTLAHAGDDARKIKFSAKGDAVKERLAKAEL
ncbi:MAG: tRNA (adenosine(37)-N6)-threonylcarbamoyltransferase complex ATPase subunit type 1 TsaE [Candidatus Omnitrophica bacterium]|nr:tRNA (adenosine(37)-N6)-threonylcarbamoyltransferase complex ATPase subunit type 1 TsaE [Candidatus Omnitrophota bacterium]